MSLWPKDTLWNSAQVSVTHWPALPQWPGNLPVPVPAGPTQAAYVDESTADLILLSASQVDTFADCERKWGFEKLDKLPKAPDASARLGSDVHGVAEDWLNQGTPPDLARALVLPKGRGAPGTNTFFPGQIFDAGRPHLPAIGTVHVEGRRKWTTPGIGSGPIRWQGTRDGLTVRLPDGTTIRPYRPDGTPIQLPDGARLEVWDHKTTSDFKYMKHLPTNIQGNLYAWDTLTEFGVQEVDAKWLYYLTRGRPKSRLDEHTYTKAAVTEQIYKTDTLASRMLQLYREKPAAKELTPNPQTCDKYGGCPYRYGSTCPLSISQRMTTMTATPPSPQQNFEALLAAARNGVNATLPAPGADLAAAFAAPTPAPQPMPAPAPFWKPGDPMNQAQEWFLTQPNAKWSTLAHAANVPEQLAQAYDALFEPPGRYGVITPRAQVTPSAPPAPGAAVNQGINPPDAPAYAATNPETVPMRVGHVAVPVQSVGGATAVVANDPFAGLDRDALKSICVAKGLCSTKCRIKDVERFKEALLTGVKIPDPGEAPNEAPAAPTLPTYPTPSAQERQVGIPETAPVPPSVAAPAQASTPAPAPAPETKGPGFALYVYCLPVSGQAHTRLLRLSGICGQIFPELTKRTGALHYSMIDFGKGRGAFAGLLEEFLQATKLGPETAIVVERTPEGADALTVLERYAGSIVRGL